MLLERLAVLIGGFAAGALMRCLRSQPVAPPDRTVRDLRTLVRGHEQRLGRLETRSQAHEEKLREIPSMAQLTAAMEELLAKAMSGLDVRLTAQAQSIETLQTTVSQTDELLERVLESLDTLAP